MGQGARRPSQKSLNGHNPDDTNSPISRTATPNMYQHSHMPMYHNLDDQFQAQQIPGFGVGASPGRAPSPLNGGGDMPQTHEALIAANASLKTRVSELEVIQELYRGRLHQLEQEETMRQQELGKGDISQIQAQLNAMTEANAQLQKDLEESHRRENIMKRRLDELEIELKEAKATVEEYEGGRPTKKVKLEEPAVVETQAQLQPEEVVGQPDVPAVPAVSEMVDIPLAPEVTEVSEVPEAPDVAADPVVPDVTATQPEVST